MAKSCLQKRIIKNRLEGLANKRYSLESSFLLKNTYKNVTSLESSILSKHFNCLDSRLGSHLPHNREVELGSSHPGLFGQTPGGMHPPSRRKGLGRPHGRSLQGAVRDGPHKRENLVLKKNLIIKSIQHKPLILFNSLIGGSEVLRLSRLSRNGGGGPKVRPRRLRKFSIVLQL